MKSYKGGFTEQQNAENEAHKKGQEMREAAEAMLVAAKGDLEAAKNLTSDKIKEALEEKQKMEEKINKLMNDPALKEKITENADKFKETLNDLSKTSMENAEKGLAFAKGKFEEGKQALSTFANSQQVADAKEKATKGFSSAFGSLKNYAKVGENMARGALDMNTNRTSGTNGGKRKNKTKKLTKKEKKMKKARK